MARSILHYHVSPAGVQELLTGGGEFLPPERLLGDLTEAQALAVPPGSPYSIAGLVAHMRFWQDYNIARARGQHTARPEHLDETFPEVRAGEWAALRQAFLTGLEICAQTAAEKSGETSTDRADTSVGYDLVECPALHNAYHYGQIAMLRQIQGFWPPAGGDGSW
ncbi:MAG: DinB family protein [Armatimonadota bacterium]|nr:DinB family protein [Armatimonadota bacterium]